MSADYSIKFVRLNNGEDLIANVSYVPEFESEPAYYILNNPMKIIYMPSTVSGSPGMSISMMQWVFNRISEEQEFNLYSRDILFTSKPTENLIKFYNESIEKYKNKDNTDFDLTEEEEYEDNSEDMEMLHNLIEQLRSSKKTIH